MKTVLDCGAFSAMNAAKKGKTIVYDMSNPRNYYGNYFNLTPVHAIRIQRKLQLDVMISLDKIAPKVSTDPEREYQWMAVHTFNVLNCIRTVELKEIYCKNIDMALLVPLQVYDLQQFSIFLKDIQRVMNKIDGFSCPRRNLNPIKLILFLLKIYLTGKTQICHILGTTAFGMVVVCAYAARHWFDVITYDATSWRLYSKWEYYLFRYNLKSLRLRKDIFVDRSVLSAPLSCDCEWCQKYANLGEIRDLEYSQKREFLERHNFFVIDKFCQEAFEHADSVSELKRYLFARTKGSRNEEIEQICRYLEIADKIKDTISHKGLEALWRQNCK
ncbi:MAG TPA: hypothetical protein PLH43_12090 [Acetivibrio sp.]|uniref:hypothetical protein n=1 Tax=Acetivibrio sp. TaxID=1872092 RepID=UPI002D1E2CBA|nr:hypothetical protein [Acetivibrio sp.]HOM03546.1 hypothetical protein [Acetivibrio sp.]